MSIEIPVGSSPKLAPNPALAAQKYISEQNMRELARFEMIRAEIINFQEKGIQDLIEKHAEIMRQEIQEAAPYDFQELDDYHMKDHMERRDYNGRLGKGQEVESEAPYSGLLEYGTARHRVQYVFFRPSVERGQREFKAESIRILKRIYSK